MPFAPRALGHFHVHRERLARPSAADSRSGNSSPAPRSAPHSAGGSLPLVRNRRMLAYDAVSTSIENVDSGCRRGSKNAFSIIGSYCSVPGVPRCSVVPCSGAKFCFDLNHAPSLLVPSAQQIEPIRLLRAASSRTSNSFPSASLLSALATCPCRHSLSASRTTKLGTAFANLFVAPPAYALRCPRSPSCGCSELPTASVPGTRRNHPTSILDSLLQDLCRRPASFPSLSLEMPDLCPVHPAVFRRRSQKHNHLPSHTRRQPLPGGAACVPGRIAKPFRRNIRLRTRNVARRHGERVARNRRRLGCSASATGRLRDLNSTSVGFFGTHSALNNYPTAL